MWSGKEKLGRLWNGGKGFCKEDREEMERAVRWTGPGHLREGEQAREGRLGDGPGALGLAIREEEGGEAGTER